MVDRISEKSLTQSAKSALLIGPRQVGKSTLLKNLKPDLAINLSSEAEFYRFSSNPDLLSSLIRGSDPTTVLIDEVQRLPSILNTVQAILDDWPSPPRFFLSGSSARKLRRGGANLLPGRILTYQMGGLSSAELDYALDIQKGMRVGFLPQPYLETDLALAENLMLDYATTYLVEEIQAEALTRDIQGFSRFLRIIAPASGLILDTSKLAKKAHVSRSTLNRYLDILEDTLIARRVFSFTDTDADVIRHPRLFFFDPGVYNGLLENFTASLDRVGTLFEHAVYAQILNSAKAAHTPVNISYFRTRGGTEVDFIVELRGKVYAIEAKYGHVNAADIRGLNRFREYYPDVFKSIIVSTEPSRLVLEDGTIACDINLLMKELEL